MLTRSTCLILLGLAAAGCQARFEAPEGWLQGAAGSMPPPEQDAGPEQPPEGPEQGPAIDMGGTDVGSKPKPETLPRPEIDSYEVNPAKGTLTLRGKTVAGADVKLYREGSGCKQQLGKQTVSKSGAVSLTVDDFRDSKTKGFEVLVAMNDKTSKCESYLFKNVKELNPAPAKPTIVEADPPSGSDFNDVRLGFETTGDFDQVLVFNNSTKCEGEPARTYKKGVHERGLYFASIAIADDTTNELTIATVLNGKRSPCSNVFVWVEKSETPVPGPYVTTVVPEPGSIFGYQIAGQLPPGATAKFFDDQACNGKDLTRNITVHATGAFTAQIDVPHNTQLPSLGFQVIEGNEVRCEYAAASIDTRDENTLQIEPVSRTRVDDASVDVALRGTAHGSTITAYFSDTCDGDAVSTTEISRALPYEWSLSFNHHGWHPQGLSFLLTGVRTSNGIEELCIAKPTLLQLATNPSLPMATVTMEQDEGETERFLIVVPKPSDDVSFYVNLAYDASCTNTVFRGAVKADYLVSLPKPITELYGYTENDAFERSPCAKLY
jgi:hypothetical protein